MRHDEAAAIAKSVLTLRQKRADHLPTDFLGEHWWGILLALFVADAEGTRVTALDIFSASDTPRTLGRRWMKALMDADLVVSEGPCDGQNIVALTPRGIHAVEGCMTDAQELMGTKATAAF